MPSTNTKLNEIVSFFKKYNKDLLKMDWNDGVSKEYEFRGLTYIQFSNGDSVLSNYDGEIASINKNGTSSLDEGFDDEIEEFNTAHESFIEDKKEYLREKANKMSNDNETSMSL